MTAPQPRTWPDRPARPDLAANPAHAADPAANPAHTATPAEKLDPAHAADPAEKLDPAVVKLIVILLLGAVPSLLDTTIVNVAIDTVGRDLHTTVATIQWVITGYLLSFGMVIPLSGWALARFGGRATWVTSLALFLAGSVLSGAAWNIGALIAFRVLQGIGGGMLLPLLTTLITQAAGGRQLGRLMASVSLPVAVVPILGPVISGLIITNVSWRWIFYVNVPICLAGLVFAWRGLPGRAALPSTAGRPGEAKLDMLGLVLLCPALAGLLYGLAQVSTAGGFGHARVLVPVVAGALLLAGFVVHALRMRGVPLVDLRLFRSRAFSGATSLMFLAGLSIYGAMLLLPLYFQQARGASALEAGLLLVPQGVGSILPRTVVGKLTDRIGPRPVSLAGIVLAAVGTVPFALAGPRTSEILLAGALVVRGAGLGAATIALMAGAFSGLARDELPHASSATRIMQQVGGAFGAAVLVVILASQTTAQRMAGAAGLAAAFGHTFWWCVGFTALAVLPALLLPGRPAPAVTQPPTVPGPAEASVAARSAD
jgi:EmrB/QacA subfamily drug resistance transporter